MGIASGITGTFLMLRRRALAGDVIGHAAVPGVAFAFLVYSSFFPDNPKNMPVLLVGAALASGLGMLAVLWLRRVGRLPDDVYSNADFPRVVSRAQYGYSAASSSVDPGAFLVFQPRWS